MVIIVALDPDDRAHRLGALGRHSVLTTIGVVLALLVSVAIGVAALVGTGHSDLAGSRYQWRALVGYLLLAAPLALLRRTSERRQALGLRRPVRWWPYAPIPLIVIVHFFEANSLAMAPGLPLTLLLCGFALLIGFIKEVLFRGVLIAFYENVGVAVAVSTLLFGFIHAVCAFGTTSDAETVATILFAIAWGAFAALTYVAGRSVVPLILPHWLWDWWSLLNSGPLHIRLLLVSTAIMLIWSMVMAVWLWRAGPDSLHRQAGKR